MYVDAVGTYEPKHTHLSLATDLPTPNPSAHEALDFAVELILDLAVELVVLPMSATPVDAVCPPSGEGDMRRRANSDRSALLGEQ